MVIMLMQKNAIIYNGLKNGVSSPVILMEVCDIILLYNLFHF